MSKKRKRAWWESDLAKLAFVALGVGTVGVVIFRATSASAQEEGEEPGASPERDFPLLAQLSAYWPAATPDEEKEEGGSTDIRDRPLHSLQDYLSGNAPFVSVAADMSQIEYNEPIEIKELNEKYGRKIDFRVCDALHADLVRKGKGTGTRRLDIRVASRKDGLADSVNSWVHYRRLSPPSGAIVAEVPKS